ncbi:hypothetical protein E8E12_007877 [Didymella heteroderae]|uniref:Uncharacterized protein n=1 Tax=Didymella heteroderae TaxID=1769908 RepID=A0A9P4WRL3_9PLEO|nr:hypothetical protein E8E12_007877 [Didymella heteroderae]
MDALYAPLDITKRELRLLELAPGDYEDDLIIILRVESLDRDLPVYNALSYALGQDACRHLAVVGDGRVTAPAAYGQNLPYWFLPSRAVHPGSYLKESSHLPDRIEVSKDLKRLYTHGMHLGNIVAVCATSSDLKGFNYLERAEAMQEFYNMHLKPRQIPARTLLQALTIDGKTPVRDPQFSSQLPHLFEQLVTMQTDMQAFAPCYNLMVALFGHEESHVFVTDQNRVGVAYHPDAEDGKRAGDELVGLFGINFPFVLRPVTGNAEMNQSLYNPLNPELQEIRLLEIAPGNYDDDLVINLRIKRLNKKRPKFNALSYAWGKGRNSSKATINAVRDETSPGDVVARLFGRNYPFVLRPLVSKDNGEQMYTMVNVTSVVDHKYGHDFVKIPGPGAKWEDLEQFGLREYTII